MAMFDLFGLHKDSEMDDPTGQPPGARPHRNCNSFWARLLLLSGLLTASLGAVMAWRAYQLLLAPTAVPMPVTRPPRISPKKPEPATPPVPAQLEMPASKAPSPSAPNPAHAGKTPSPAPAASAKGPLGSPTVNSPELPQRRVPNLAGSAKKQAAAEAADAGKKSSRTSKSVVFTYSAPDAKQVFLLGPFLVRTGGRKALSKDSSGLWRTSIYLNAGTTYHYRFEVTDSQGKKTVTPKKALKSF